MKYEQFTENGVTWFRFQDGKLAIAAVDKIYEIESPLTKETLAEIADGKKSLFAEYAEAIYRFLVRDFRSFAYVNGKEIRIYIVRKKDSAGKAQLHFYFVCSEPLKKEDLELIFKEKSIIKKYHETIYESFNKVKNFFVNYSFQTLNDGTTQENRWLDFGNECFVSKEEPHQADRFDFIPDETEKAISLDI